MADGDAYPVSDRRPTPDPTVLTTEALTRAIQAERDWASGQLDVLSERMNGIDRATTLRVATIDHLPQRIDEKVDNLRTLHDEKFGSVAIQFKERDTRQERECLSADEPVLCADLVWRAAGTLQVGDELIALDEEPQPGRKGRCYRRAVVTANSIRPDALVSVNTTRGSVRCNSEHPWLVRDQTHGGAWHWVKTDRLSPGATVMSVLDVWETNRSYEAGWLAGILDGEGYVHSGYQAQQQSMGTKIIVAQVRGPLDDAIGFALTELGIGVKRYTKPAVGNAREQSVWQIASRPEVLRLLGSIRPTRLLAKADSVWEGVALFSPSRGTTATVLSVTDAGTGTIAMLSTSTGTYIGAGFAHHNSRDNKVAVDAAFAAQKEAAAKQDEANSKAIDKSEGKTAETIKTNQELSKANTDALTKSLDEVKLIVNTLTSIKQGSHDSSVDLRALESSAITRSMRSIAIFSASFAGLAVLISIILAVLLATKK